jgi:ATP-binding protein involved in chromosome partitioning
MADRHVTDAEVRAVLNEFLDPELGRSVVRLEQVHQIEIVEGRVRVVLGLTTFSAPLWEDTRNELTKRLQARLPRVTIEVQIAPHSRPAEPIGEIGLRAKSVIAVGSGKGGVGKSTIAALLAYGLSRSGAQVGLMDADVYGPSIPHLLGSTDRPTINAGRIQPVTVHGMVVMSMGFLVPPGEAVIWRGPMLHGAMTQFLRDTDWGNLDYLMIDLPPGTGDISLSLSQLLPLSGAVVVCTPQDVALLDATKAIAMYRKLNIEVLGMVENMSFFQCPNCGSRHEIFGSGGARRQAEQLHVPVLGEVPLNAQLRVLGDEGRLGAAFDDATSRPYLDGICENMVRNLIAHRRQQPPMPTLSVLK